jgi:hypothetical protein
MATTKKPKAQLGAIVKAIGKGFSAGTKVAKAGIKAAKASKASKFAEETKHMGDNQMMKYAEDRARTKANRILGATAATGVGALSLATKTKTARNTNSKGTATTVNTRADGAKQIKVKTAAGKTYYKKK